jgi:hypothetical protein
MSEEYNVEDGTGPAEPVAEPVAEPAAAPEPVAAHEPDAVEVAGQRMVPLAALQAAREEARTLKQKAEQVDQVSAWYQANRPYVEFLQNNPDLLKPRPAAPAPPPAPTPPEQDETLTQLARTLDLYTPEGKPDATRAAVIRNLVKSEAQTIAQEAVKPLEAMTTRERANANLQYAYSATTPDGHKADPEVLKQIWANGDPKVLSTPEGAAMAVLMAVGMSQFARQPQAPQPAAPNQPPVVTEPVGGRNINRAPISEFEQRIANVRGIAPQKYAELTRDFKPGHVNVLED